MSDDPEQVDRQFHATDGWQPKLLTSDQVHEIKRRWPNILAYQIDRVAEGARADLQNSQPRAGSRKTLRSICKRAADLHQLLQGALRSDADIKSAVFNAEFFSAQPGASVVALQALQGLLAAAERRLPAATAAKWPERLLVDDIAQIVADAGYPAGRVKASPLVDLVDMVLVAVAPHRKGRLGSAESVVEHWEKSRAK